MTIQAASSKPDGSGISQLGAHQPLSTQPLQGRVDGAEGDFPSRLSGQDLLERSPVRLGGGDEDAEKHQLLELAEANLVHVGSRQSFQLCCISRQG